MVVCVVCAVYGVCVLLLVFGRGGVVWVLCVVCMCLCVSVCV